MRRVRLTALLLSLLFAFPLSAAQEALVPAGGEADEDCFFYARSGEGYVLTGLTEKGKSMEALAVPSAYEALPVLSFDQALFAGNKRLRELTLPASVRFIPDGAFSGCAALEAITLLQEDPGACTVGQELLSGTDANVFVPSGRYAAYCMNYFWAVHAPRLRPLNQGEQAAAAPARQEAPPQATRIRYEGNGGAARGRAGDSLTREIAYAHRRENTLQGMAWFERKGYVLTGWNTRADGSGLSAGLGSRIDPPADGVLYAQWLPCSPEEDFDWETDGKSAAITGYHGEGGVCVLPESREGLPVRVIRRGAFQGADFSLLAFSPSLRTVEDGAFSGCGIETLLLYDSLKAISDSAFSACRGPARLRVNAAVNPVYSGSYFDTFQDKYDYLLSLRGKKKLILFSGSSGRYGYDSSLFRKAFPDLEPVNMGVYAFTSALPQLRLILPLAEEGDILLFAPEFDAVPEQFCASDRLDSGFWAMMEANYDAAAELDMRSFTGVFDSLGEYLSIRSRMPTKDYALSPAQFDDDGRSYAFSTYNQYGDFILPRPNGDSDERLRHNIADYTAESFPLEIIQSLNAALSPFREKGVSVYFTYTPRNVNSLTEQSTPEARRALHEWLKENLEVPVISEIESSLLPGRYFWLIDSHTSTEGARIRTQRVIHDLEKALTTDPERSDAP